MVHVILMLSNYLVLVTIFRFKVSAIICCLSIRICHNRAQIFAGCNFLNIRIFCFSLSFMTVNEKSLGFGLKQFEKTYLSSGKL